MEVEYIYTQVISRANTNSSILNYTYICVLKPSYSCIGVYILFSQHLNTFKSLKCYWVSAIEWGIEIIDSQIIKSTLLREYLVTIKSHLYIFESLDKVLTLVRYCHQIKNIKE
jgi:hypothetical protein